MAGALVQTERGLFAKVDGNSDNINVKIDAANKSLYQPQSFKMLKC